MNSKKQVSRKPQQIKDDRDKKAAYMRNKRLEEGFAEDERLRAMELRNQTSVKERREAEASLRDPTLASLEELLRVEAENDYRSHVRDEHEILLEAQSRLSYESMTYNCCVICEQDCVKKLTSFHKIDDDILLVRYTLDYLLTLFCSLTFRIF